MQKKSLDENLKKGNLLLVMGQQEQQGITKKMQNELYRLTFCENVLKIALGTQPQRPQLGSKGFPGKFLG
jgi:hypothetical protein